MLARCYNYDAVFFFFCKIARAHTPCRHSPIRPGVEDIKFVVTDRERDAKGEEQGSMRITLEELSDQHVQDRNDHLIRRDGLRTRAKLHVLVKYIYSQVAADFLLLFLIGAARIAWLPPLFLSCYS